MTTHLKFRIEKRLLRLRKKMLFGYKINLSQFLLSIFILQITRTQSQTLTSKAGVNYLPTRSNPGLTVLGEPTPTHSSHNMDCIPTMCQALLKVLRKMWGTKQKWKWEDKSCIFKLYWQVLSLAAWFSSWGSVLSSCNHSVEPLEGCGQSKFAFRLLKER